MKKFLKNIKDTILPWADRLNSCCREYTPIIQVIGLIIAILILANNTNTLNIMNRSLNFEKYKYHRSQKQNWMFSVENGEKYIDKKIILMDLSVETNLKYIRAYYPNSLENTADALTLPYLFDLSDYSLRLDQLSFMLEEIYTKKYNEKYGDKDNVKIETFCMDDSTATMGTFYSSELPMFVNFEYITKGDLKTDANIYMLKYTVNIERDCKKLNSDVNYETFLLDTVLTSNVERNLQFDDSMGNILDDLWDKSKITGRDNGLLNNLKKILDKEK